MSMQKHTVSEGDNSYLNEFTAYCEAEFERRRNSDKHFDQPHYQAAMQWVVDKLKQLPPHQDP
jgi:hypothetical protein